MLNYENKINKKLAKFDMTFAKNRTNRAPEIWQNVNESTFLAKHRPLEKIWHVQNVTRSKYDMSTANLHITGNIDLTKKITTIALT